MSCRISFQAGKCGGEYEPMKPSMIPTIINSIKPVVRHIDTMNLIFSLYHLLKVLILTDRYCLSRKSCVTEVRKGQVLFANV